MSSVEMLAGSSAARNVNWEASPFAPLLFSFSLLYFFIFFSFFLFFPFFLPLEVEPRNSS